MYFLYIYKKYWQFTDLVGETFIKNGKLEQP